MKYLKMLLPILKSTMLFIKLSEYIVRTSQRFHLRRNQHVSKSLRNWMVNRNSKRIKSPSAIGNHFLNYPECSKHYNDNKFMIQLKYIVYITKIYRNLKYLFKVLTTNFTKITFFYHKKIIIFAKSSTRPHFL